MRAEQNEYQQQEILRLASRNGELGQLFWYIQMILPSLSNGQRKRMTPAEIADYARRRCTSACYPGSYIPIIPVAPDPARSRADAEYLAAFFTVSNDERVVFRPALAMRSEIEAASCYLYPDEADSLPLDTICPHCAAILDNGICPACSPSPSPILLFDGALTHLGQGRPAAPRCGAPSPTTQPLDPTPARLQLLAPTLCPICFDL